MIKLGDLNSSQVFGFLQARADTPANFGIDPGLGPQLQLILKQLRSLSLPDGNQYNNFSIRPDQHIHRALNPIWTICTPDKSKFIAARTYFHRFDNGWPFVAYWTPYDLLGLFLSKLGPAPYGQNADKINFYLPLTAVYGRWCMLLAGNRTNNFERRHRREGGVGDPSFFYNCTWNPDDGVFFLGAALAGYDWTNPSNPNPQNRVDNRVGTWEADLKQARYSLLISFYGITIEFSFEESPTIERRGKRRSPSFLFIIRTLGIVSPVQRTLPKSLIALKLALFPQNTKGLISNIF
ncbi:hypothetical protein F4824DRAFT_186033 [Ustulina deusta]|nr:hypothetical protein F4824DRAFT_186033 [Ustulina deusta]